jgi:uncharacterized protein (TIGR01777 family)
VRILIPGGTGNVGSALRRYWESAGHSVTVLTRHPHRSGEVEWDGKTQGPWFEEVSKAEVVVNLAGRTVNCRYSPANLAEMMSSRTDSTRIVGQAIAAADPAPRLWLQASTATVYAHRFDAPNDEDTGILGGRGKGAPPKWEASEEIGFAWERELADAATPQTRKVAMRTSLVMSPDKGSVFDVFATLARRGLLGRQGSGKQFISWIHELDFARALDLIIENDSLQGPINLCSPNPVPNELFNRILREAVGARIALPAPAFLLEIGAFFMGTETELILKSRRVTPGQLLAAGFQFSFPRWEGAAAEIAEKWKALQINHSR